jgi:hypothetical protein
MAFLPVANAVGAPNIRRCDKTRESQGFHGTVGSEIALQAWNGVKTEGLCVWVGVWQWGPAQKMANEADEAEKANKKEHSRDRSVENTVA